MTVSYVLIFLLLIVLLVSLFSSYNHVFKSTITSLISLVLVVALVYVDYSFNSLKIVTSLSSKIATFLNFLEIDYHVTNLDMVAEGVLYLSAYLISYIVFYVIMKLCVVNKLEPERKAKKFGVFILRIFNFALLSFLVLLFTSYLSPIFRLEDGFLDVVLEIFRWRVTLL